jgi:hypothetical protein
VVGTTLPNFRIGSGRDDIMKDDDKDALLVSILEIPLTIITRATLPTANATKMEESKHNTTNRLETRTTYPS